jgi:SAM-dependent methyltransferase
MPDAGGIVGALRTVAQAGLHRVGAHDLAWRLGLAEERAFWDQYLATRGLHWPEEYADRVRPDRQLDGVVADLIRSVDGDPVRVLDVGSGPLSAFAGNIPGRAIEVTAVDPLADWYGRLYERHGVMPPVRPRPGRVEELERLLPTGHFDVVAARNALDHCADPVEGVRQMLSMTRPGGWVYLEHAEREGATRRYRGLHHWDLWVADGRLRLGHRGDHVDLADGAGARVVESTTDDEGWVRATLQRSA